MIILAGLFLSTLMLQNPLACPYTTGPNGAIIVGPECTTDKMFKDYANGDFRPVISNPGVGHAICPANLDPLPIQPVLDTLSFDPAGTPRPNRPPNTLFPGDTGCDIGAFQFPLTDTPAPVVTIRIVPVSN